MAALTAKEELAFQRILKNNSYIRYRDGKYEVCSDHPPFFFRVMRTSSSLRELISGDIIEESLNWKLNEPESQ